MKEKTFELFFQGSLVAVFMGHCTAARECIRKSQGLYLFGAQLAK